MNLDQIKKDAEILADTEMEEVKGGRSLDMAVSDACATCCAASNGGIQQPGQLQTNDR